MEVDEDDGVLVLCDEFVELIETGDVGDGHVGISLSELEETRQQ